jgi:hypothetical protein
MWRTKVAGFFLQALVLVAAAGPVESQQILVVSPALPTTTDQVTFFISIVDCGFSINKVVQGHAIYLYPDTSIGCPPLIPPQAGVVTFATVGPLGSGSYTVSVVNMAGQTTDTRTIFVQTPSTQLSLLQGRFTATVSWTAAEGQSGGPGQAVQVSDSSGYFWFFNSGEAELTVKLVDATSLDFHYWVFVASGTTVGFSLTIVDNWLCTSPALCRAHSYQVSPGTNQNIFDFSTFGYL